MTHFDFRRTVGTRTDRSRLCHRVQVRISQAGRRPTGLTLIEICFTIALLTIVGAVALTSLGGGGTRDRTSSRGLAVALADEYRAARQIAIARGYPTAVGIPTSGGTFKVGTSVYRLEGWSAPRVTWSKGYSGDYPGHGFAAAGWPASGFEVGAELPLVAKYSSFDLGRWIPEAMARDQVVCFTPDGGVLTNHLLAKDGRYTIVVGGGLSVGGGASPNEGVGNVLAANEPAVIYISPSGGVEIETGLLGGSVPTGAAKPSAGPPVPPTPHDDTTVITLSELILRPTPDPSVSDRGLCTPGQQVTMEIWAYDPEGRQLFAKWNQPNEKGVFTYPASLPGAPLNGEVGRMEFFHKVPPELDWPGGTAPTNGAYRARWSWTVPVDSAPGDEYQVTVDVQNAEADATILNPPEPIVWEVAPEGRIIVEKQTAPGLWQLVQMNPDGSGEKVLSPPGVPESMPSVDRGGTKLAFLQGPPGSRYVKIRALKGGSETTLAGPGDFTSVSLSPDGGWVSYRNDATSRLFFVRSDGSGEFDQLQAWSGGGHTVKKSRTGWSSNSRFAVWGNGPEIMVTNLSSQGTSTLIPQIQNGSLPDPATGLPQPNFEQLFAPVCFRTPDNVERIMFSLGSIDPVLLHTTVDFAGSPSATTFGTLGEYESPELGGPGVRGSGNIDDDFPDVSLDGSQLLLTRSPETSGAGEDDADQSVRVVNWNGAAGNFVGPGHDVPGDVRRAVWVPQ